MYKFFSGLGKFLIEVYKISMPLLVAWLICHYALVACRYFHSSTIRQENKQFKLSLEQPDTPAVPQE